MSESAFSNTEQPAFQSSDHEMELASPKLSLVALAALLASFLSLMAPMSQIGLPLCIIAVFLGVVALLRIKRDPDLSGALISQFAITLGIATFTWATVARRGGEQYLYDVAGKHAEMFANMLADEGKRYEVFELLRTESDRQMSGTDLEKYYASADEETLSSIESFLANKATEHICETGTEAKWKYVGGVEIDGTPDSRYVTVKLTDTAGKGRDLQIIMQRITGMLVEDEGEPTAHWNVYDLQLP